MRRWIVPALLALTLSGSSSAAPDGAVRLTTLTSVSDPAWSPDGQTLAFGHDFDIWTLPASGGTPVRLTTDSEFDFGPCWSPSGDRIAFERDLDIWVVDPLTGVETPLITGADWQQWPTWSPAGQRIAYSVSTGSGNWEIWVTNLQNGNTFPLVQIPGIDANYPAWSPDGRFIAFEARDVNNEADLGIVNVLTGNVEPLVALATHDGHPSWAPSGAFLVFETERDAVSVLDSDIWIMPMYDGVAGTASPLSCSDAFDISPAWSPMGDTVAFLSERDLLGGQFDLYVLGPDVVAVGESTSTTPPGGAPRLLAAPNPFRASGSVRLEVPVGAADAWLRIANVQGRLVRRVFVGRGTGGRSVVWDGRDDAGRATTPGIYFATIGGITTRLIRTP